LKVNEQVKAEVDHFRIERGQSATASLVLPEEGGGVD
jgi:hypothetical protein